MLKVINNNAPDYLTQICTIHQSEIANSKNRLYLPRPRLGLFKTSIYFSGTRIAYW